MDILGRLQISLFVVLYISFLKSDASDGLNTVPSEVTGLERKRDGGRKKLSRPPSCGPH